jgi:ABC-type lipoprotein export system ATPase subunit
MRLKTNKKQFSYFFQAYTLLASSSSATSLLLPPDSENEPQPKTTAAAQHLFASLSATPTKAAENHPLPQTAGGNNE